MAIDPELYPNDLAKCNELQCKLPLLMHRLTSKPFYCTVIYEATKDTSIDLAKPGSELGQDVTKNIQYLLEIIVRNRASQIPETGCPKELEKLKPRY